MDTGQSPEVVRSTEKAEKIKKKKKKGKKGKGGAVANKAGSSNKKDSSSPTRRSLGTLGLHSIKPSYRELSLKQITEALGSAGSSQSSMT